MAALRLLHEGGLPMGLSFDVDDDNGLFALTLAGDLPLAISSVWYHLLILAVVGHPVNADIFPTQQELVLRRLKAHEAVGQRVIGRRIADLLAPTTKAQCIERFRGGEPFEGALIFPIGRPLLPRSASVYRAGCIRRMRWRLSWYQSRPVNR